MNKEDKLKLEVELQTIMLIAKDLMRDGLPEELKFLVNNIPGIKKKQTVIPHKPSAHEVKFEDYLKQLRSGVDKIERIAPHKYKQRQEQIQEFF